MVEELLTAITENKADLALCGYFTQYDDHNVVNLLPHKKSLLQGREEITE